MSCCPTPCSTSSAYAATAFIALPEGDISETPARRPHCWRSPLSRWSPHLAQCADRIRAKLDHDRRADRARRRQRCDGAHRRPAADRETRQAGDRRQQARWRRQHRRRVRRASRPRTATRSCGATSPRTGSIRRCRSFRYDPIKDFEPIGLVAESQTCWSSTPARRSRTWRADRGREGQARRDRTTRPRATARRRTWPANCSSCRPAST